MKVIIMYIHTHIHKKKKKKAASERAQAANITIEDPSKPETARLIHNLCKYLSKNKADKLRRGGGTDQSCH